MIRFPYFTLMLLCSLLAYGNYDSTEQSKPGTQEKSNGSATTAINISPETLMQFFGITEQSIVTYRNEEEWEQNSNSGAEDSIIKTGTWRLTASAAR